MNNLTIVIPSYNNLEYLKLCYKSIRRADKGVKLILIDDGSTDGTRNWLHSIVDAYTSVMSFNTRMGHTKLYDLGFSYTDTEYIGILHADMVVAPNFFEVLETQLAPNKIVSAVCVEPPIHGEGYEKIVKQFGMYPSEFKQDEFDEYALAQMGYDGPSLFAPWFMNRNEYFNRLGGHDQQFAPYGYEDSDIFVRMKKAGFNIVQRRNLVVYHFTQRGHKWQNGSMNKTNDDYQLQMIITRNRFLRKWGTFIARDEKHAPVDIPLYYKQLTIKNYQLTDARNKYEFINMLFNRVVTDTGALIKTDGKDHIINYDVALDYSVSYEPHDLQQFMMQIPMLVEQNDIGTYEQGGITLTIFNNKEKLSIIERGY